MTSPPPQKRPRLQSARNTLSQPFKSPLAPASANASLSSPAKPQSSPLRRGADSCGDGGRGGGGGGKRLDALVGGRGRGKGVGIGGGGGRGAGKGAGAGEGKWEGGGVGALKKHATRLLTQLAGLQTEVQLATQAVGIEAPSPSPFPSPSSFTPQPKLGLDDLTHKWKLASRAAAEEVYGSARERVDKMGGLAGLREQERGRRERLERFEREEWEMEVQRRREERRRERGGEEVEGEDTATIIEAEIEEGEWGGKGARRSSSAGDGEGGEEEGMLADEEGGIPWA